MARHRIASSDTVQLMEEPIAAREGVISMFRKTPVSAPVAER